MMTTEEILLLLCAAVAIAIGTFWLVMATTPAIGNEVSEAYKAAKGITVLVYYNKFCARVPDRTMFWAAFVVADLPPALLRAAVQEVRFEILSTPHDKYCAAIKPGIDRANAALVEQFEGFALPPPVPPKRKK
jgi:hypothetical protein